MVFMIQIKNAMYSDVTGNFIAFRCVLREHIREKCNKNMFMRPPVIKYILKSLLVINITNYKKKATNF